MSTLKAVRGTRDLLPPETELWNFVERTAREVFSRYNFGEIRTPIFEDTQLFARGVGEETDIVSKEMYTWEDRARAQSEKSQHLTLRPENTAGVVRAYIEHKLGETGMLQKLYYIGPQFRRERPQKGRYRQFFQIGAEVIGPPSSGSESPLRDAEVLEMLAAFLDELKITGWTLALNSVGSSTDRPRYIAALKEALLPVKDQMCVDCQRRADTNPLRVLDCKVPEDQPIIDTLPKIADYLDDASKAHFAQVLAALDACGVPYTINPRLVRGLDYYTRTTFEFTIETGLGTQNALLGGGRYDGLSEMIGGPKAPGIGFAIGEDRLILTLQAQAEATASPSGKADAYIAPMGEAQNAAALSLARELRHAGLTIELGDGTFKAGKSKEMAEKTARRILFVGESESRAGVFFAHDFTTDQTRYFSREALAKNLRSADWRIGDPLASSLDTQKQAIGLQMHCLQILEISEQPLSLDTLRIFLAVSLGIPPKKMLAEAVERAVSDLLADGFIESVNDEGWIISLAGRKHLDREIRREESDKEEWGTADSQS